MDRPDELDGKTYTIVPVDGAKKLYITVNHITDPETSITTLHEVFIDTKNLMQYEYLVALSRVLSYTIRHGADIPNLMDELHTLCDTGGGYWDGGKHRSGVCSHIGAIILHHYDEYCTKPEVVAEDKK